VYKIAHCTCTLDTIAMIAKMPSMEQDGSFNTGPYGRTNDGTTLRENERIHICSVYLHDALNFNDSEEQCVISKYEI
jgi:hypothetical protein